MWRIRGSQGIPVSFRQGLLMRFEDFCGCPGEIVVPLGEVGPESLVFRRLDSVVFVGGDYLDADADGEIDPDFVDFRFVHNQ